MWPAPGGSSIDADALIEDAMRIDTAARRVRVM